MSRIRVAFTAAPDASGHYRIRQPAEAVERLYGDRFSVQFGNLRQLAIGTFDLLVLQRPMYSFMPGLIDEVRKFGVPVIIELDDDMHSIHADSPGRTLNNPRINPMQNWNHLSACLRRCDHVTVSTQALAQRYGADGRVSVLRNAVDDDWLDIPHVDHAKIVGWTGSAKWHRGDPQVTGGALSQLPDGWKFTAIGAAQDREQTAKAFGIPDAPHRFVATPFFDRSLLPYVLTGLDVGIVPLANTAFNRAKSWLKGIEYAALGIPFVASNLPEYEALTKTLDLLLANNRHRNWTTGLKTLIEDQEIRESYGRFNRAAVRQHHTVSKNAWRWAETWQHVYDKGVSNGHREVRAAKGA